jgi:hypothetical protein
VAAILPSVSATPIGERKINRAVRSRLLNLSGSE